MNSFSIFRKRLFMNWRYQLSVISKVLDWTVLVYLILPFIVIFSFIYHSWWSSPPSWMNEISLSLFIPFLYFFTWIGSIRTFILEADKVFFIKHTRSFFNLKKWGYYYTVFTSFVSTLLLLLVCMPYLVSISLSMLFIAQLFLNLFSIQLWIMLVKLWISRRKSRLLQIILSVLLFLGGFVYYITFNGENITEFILTLILCSVHGFFYFRFIQRDTFFDLTAQQEKKSFLWITTIVLRLSMQVDQTPVTTQKRPFFNRKSKRIFKKRTIHTGFLEIFTKIFWRNSAHWISYFQIITISSSAILFLPAIWLKITIIALFILFIYLWIHALWDKVMSLVPMFEKYKKEDGYLTAKRMGLWLWTGLAIFIVMINFFFALLFS